MATSSSWDYSRTATQIIQSAWEDLGIIIAGGTVPTADATMALIRLNMMAKQWQGTADGAPGMKVHTRQRITLALAKGQQTYTIGPASTDARASTLMGRTNISADEAGGQTVLSITSNTDTTSYPGTTITMANSDIIGIELNDGTIQWTTISGTPGATATVGNALTSAANAGNYVWWFTARAQRFPVLESAVWRNEYGIDSGLYVYRDVQEYQLGVPDKQNQGTPWALLCEPLRINTRITLSSQPADVTNQIVLTVLYPAEDYDAGSDDIAFPQEAFLALSWSLAKICAPAKGVVWTKDMQDNYTMAMATYRELNPANSSAYFEPGRE